MAPLSSWNVIVCGVPVGAVPDRRAAPRCPTSLNLSRWRPRNVEEYVELSGDGHAGETHARENAVVKNMLMVSVFALIFAVSASAQEGLRRGDQRFLGQQQRRDCNSSHHSVPHSGRSFHQRSLRFATVILSRHSPRQSANAGEPRLNGARLTCQLNA